MHRRLLPPQTVTTIVILAFLLVGGYYVRSIPEWIGWLKYLSFLYWGFNLLIKSQFRCASPAAAGALLPRNAVPRRTWPASPPGMPVLCVIARP